MLSDFERPHRTQSTGQKTLSRIITALILPGTLLVLWLLLPETFGPPLKEYWRWAVAAYFITLFGIYSYRSTAPSWRKARGAFWIVTLLLIGGMLLIGKEPEDTRTARDDPNWGYPAETIQIPPGYKLLRRGGIVEFVVQQEWQGFCVFSHTYPVMEVRNPTCVLYVTFLRYDGVTVLGRGEFTRELGMNPREFECIKFERKTGYCPVRAVDMRGKSNR